MATTLTKIQAAVEGGSIRYVEDLVRQALEEGIPAARILDEAMLPAMCVAGDAYKDEGGDLVHILASARCMRRGLDVLRPHLEQDRHNLGKVILGTVEGDLHDMGKNLVAIMFRCVGFEVIDLGVDVTERQFLRAVRQNPDVSLVCISSLLTTSMASMRQVVRTLRETKDLQPLKIMVGGGAITPEFAREIGADAYTETAVDAAEMAQDLVDTWEVST